MSAQLRNQPIELVDDSRTSSTTGQGVESKSEEEECIHIEEDICHMLSHGV